MGAIAGLYGAIVIGMLAAWFGGTPTQISGPTEPMTVVSAVVIFCYRLNRRFWEEQIPNRLLRLCVMHQPVFLKLLVC